MRLFAYAPLLVSTFCLILGLHVFTTGRREASNRVFALFCLFLSVWAFSEGMSRLAGSMAEAIAWQKVSALTWTLPAPLILHFALIFTGRLKLAGSRTVLAVMYLPAVFFTVIDLSTHAVVRRMALFPWGYGYVPGTWLYWLSAAWMITIALLALYLAITFSLSVADRRVRRQARLVSLAIAIPIAMAVVETAVKMINPAVPELTTISMGWLAGVIGYSVWKYELFAASPATAAESILSTMTDSLVLLDKTYKIKRVNPATLELLGYRENELLEQPGDMLFSPLDLSSRRLLSDIAAGHAVSNYETTLLTRDGRLIPVIFSSAQVTDRSGRVAAVVGLAKDIRERKRNEETIRRMAYYDPLTKLPNRSLFVERLTQAMASTRRNRSMLALHFLDLDNFKSVNDTLGHMTGDLLLVQVAERLSSCVRESDTVARLGGDEFTVVQTDLRDPDGAMALAVKIISVLSDPFQVDGISLRTSPSIGIAMYRSEGRDWEQLLKHADIAMYQAKNHDGGTFEFFKAPPRIHAQRRRSS